MTVELSTLGTPSFQSLAFLGDGYYNLRIRFWLLKFPGFPEARLQTVASFLVSAPFQAHLARRINPILTPAERDFLRRGRNFKWVGARRQPRGEYHQASALEALIGFYLFCPPAGGRTLKDFFKIIKGEIFQWLRRAIADGKFETLGR